MIRVDENIEEPEDIGRLPYLDAPTTYEYFKVSYEFFKQSILDLEQSDSTKRSIIVSHHAPSPKSLINFRHEDKVKNAYASNLEPFMRRFKPVLWMHGHHHQSIDYQVDQTRIISNPRGYSPDMLNRHFDPSLVIEI
jgi:Icc-related predicted phosphoesterase